MAEDLQAGSPGEEAALAAEEVVVPGSLKFEL